MDASQASNLNLAVIGVAEECTIVTRGKNDSSHEYCRSLNTKVCIDSSPIPHLATGPPPCRSRSNGLCINHNRRMVWSTSARHQKQALPSYSQAPYLLLHIARYDKVALQVPWQPRNGQYWQICWLCVRWLCAYVHSVGTLKFDAWLHHWAACVTRQFWIHNGVHPRRMERQRKKWMS